MTVFEMAVKKIVSRARTMAEQDRNFAAVAFDEFALAFMKWESPTYGLPPSVFMRALQTSYEQFTGRKAGQ